MSGALQVVGAEIDGYKFREALCFSLHGGIRESAKDVLPLILADGGGEITGLDDRLRGGKAGLHVNCGVRLSRTAYRVSTVVRECYLIVFAVTCPASIDDAAGIGKLSACDALLEL